MGGAGEAEATAGTDDQVGNLATDWVLNPAPIYGTISGIG